MKIIPPPCPEPEVGPKYWRSLDQLAESPSFRQWIEREFPEGASEFNDPVGRRHFIKIMSASFLLMGLGTGCRRPEERILPFSKTPEGYVHGVAQFYATARPTRSSAVPLLVKSNDGRPTKIEGNPHHPSSNGGTDSYTQAAILNLYDPDRAMRFGKGGAASTRDEAFSELTNVSRKFAATGGQGLAFLLDRSSSLSRIRLQNQLKQKFPSAKWFSYESVDFDVVRQAASLATGQSVVPEYRLEKATRILSLDCDFLGAEEDAYRHIRGFARGRKVTGLNQEINRLYSIEGLLTVTGANADHRLRLAPSQVLAAASKIALELQVAGAPAAAAFNGDQNWVSTCAADLKDQNGKAVVLVGHRQPLAVHLLAHAINKQLGAVGPIVTYRSVQHFETASIVELAGALSGGQVDTLVVLNGNPVYDAPADLNFGAAMQKAKTVIRLGYYEDETFAASTWHFPAAHFLEAWGDAVTSDGIYVPIQPLIEPMFGGVTDLEILARLAELPASKPYDIVRETFQTTFKPGNVEETWKKFLHDGFLADSAPKPVSEIGAVNFGQAQAQVLPAPSAQQLEVVFVRDYKVDDGRYNNNGWLQELPDPITKVVWENVIMVSAATAKALDLQVLKRDQKVIPGRVARTSDDLKNHDDGVGIMNDIVELELGGRKVRGPVWVQPGMADNVVGVVLGYGRTKTGRVGAGSGYNASSIRASNAPYIAPGGKLTKTAKTVRVVTTQEHGSMEGRPIVRELTVKQYNETPFSPTNMDLEAHAPDKGPIYKHPYNSHPELKNAVHQWGMAIDLTSCVGCNACMVACQSENNVPIVGKEQVKRGREMHWLRMDRYFSGTIEDPQVSNQPMTCQHCENAPCESVCPVNATVHDEEGVNVMAYNRCIGTRYCANNCAWKVRRFNFFDFNKRPNDYADDSKGAFGKLYKGPLAKREALEYDLLKMVKNPDVTVRMRGVMEKCTFCIQRIEGAKIVQKIKAGASGDVEVPDKTFTTACAQACPAEAIVFGNILDKQSEVSKLKEQQRNYATLAFLDTRPRVSYLARLRNPNPAMKDGRETPFATKEYMERQHANPFEKHSTHAGEAGHADHSHNGGAKGAKH